MTKIDDNSVSEKAKMKITPNNIAIINPCKSPDKLSMVLPVKKILMEEIVASVTVLHYLDLKKHDLSKYDAILITGQSSPWHEYDLNDFTPLKESISNGNIPTLGICGGHQLLALLYGGQVGLIIPTSCDISKGYKGCYKVKGWVDVSILHNFPIFNGYNSTSSFYASHCEEIKVLPELFTTIATTSFSKHYAFVHKEYMIYGIQFHPELPANNNKKGRQVIINFLEETGFALKKNHGNL